MFGPISTNVKHVLPSQCVNGVHVEARRSPGHGPARASHCPMRGCGVKGKVDACVRTSGDLSRPLGNMDETWVKHV